MMDPFVKQLAIIVLLCLATSPVVYALSQSVTASVSVYCPVFETLNSLSVYFIGGTVNAIYTANTLPQCSIANVPGTISIYNSLSTPFSSSNVIFHNLGPAVQNGNTQISLTAITAGNYYLNLTLKDSTYSNSVVNQFQVLSSAEPLVSNLAISPSSAGIGSQIQLSAVITNVGDLASGNVIFNISVTGPSSQNYSLQQSALSPNQNESLVTYLTGSSGSAGNYNVKVYATFGSGNSILVSNNLTGSYTINSPPPPTPGGGGSGGSPGVGPAPPVPSNQTVSIVAAATGLSFNYLPLQISTTAGTTTATPITSSRWGTGRHR